MSCILSVITAPSWPTRWSTFQASAPFSARPLPAACCDRPETAYVSTQLRNCGLVAFGFVTRVLRRDGDRSGVVAARCLVSLLCLTACSGPSDPAVETEPALGFPQAVDSVAIVGGPSGLALTDGTRLAALNVEDFPTDRATPSVAVGPDGRDVFLQLADRIGRLSLQDGSWISRPCSGCAGVASIGDAVASVRRDLTLVTFDRDLALTGNHVLTNPAAKPKAGEATNAGSSLPMIPFLAGSLGDKLVVGVPEAYESPRYGDTAVGLYSVDGHLEQVWQLPGLVSGMQASADDKHMAFIIGSSSGACYSEAHVAIVNGGADDPVVESRQAESGASFYVMDIWWNGSQVLAQAATTSNGANGCALQDMSFRMAPDGKVMPLQADMNPGPSIGATCEVALISDEAGLLRVTVGGTTRELGDFTRLVWLAPRAEPCPERQREST